MLRELDCGLWQAPSNGTYNFKFSVVDKNVGSSGYVLALDYLKFTPSSPSASTNSVTLSIAAQNGSLVLSWATNAGNFNLESVTNLSNTNWLGVSPPPVVVGSSNFVTNTVTGEKIFYRLHKP